MKSNCLRYWRQLLTGAVAASLIALICSWDTRPPEVAGAARVNRLPRIRPDYSGLVIPPNIAPLNFSILEGGRGFYAVLRGNKGNTITIRSRTSAIHIPSNAWRSLVQLNQGGELYFDLYTEAENKSWRRFDTTTNIIVAEPIDSYLIYRKIHPSHNGWSSMGIYQRNLQTFDEVPILENRHFKNDCCHCHSLGNNNPSRFTVALRSRNYGNSLLMVHDGVVTKASGTVGFTAWHPSGRLLACSFNQPILLLHSQKNDMRDIVDLGSWIGYFSTDSNVVKRIPGLTNDHRLFTFPTWSPNGSYLYFCSGPRLFTDFAEMKPDDYQKVKYDLMRVPYDLERDQWGPAEMILPVQKTGLSAAQPRISPDGRWLSFNLCASGCWPTYHPESDLYLIDLASAPEADRFVLRKMELNSEQCESWHSWSSNSRWIVFSSKREAPLFNRPYVAYVAPDGHCSKPFVVPQEDPAFYDSYLKTYTIPLLATDPVRVPERELVQAIISTNNMPLQMPAGVSVARPGPRTSQ